MPIIYFFYGIAFGGMGLAAFLQFKRGGVLPLRRQLPWLAAFGMAYAGVGWIDMFLASNMSPAVVDVLQILRMILQPLSGMLLLRFGWGMLTQITPLPDWTRIIPGIAIVPLAFVITYAMTTFVTPSPIGIPIDIWSRYLLYLPGSIMAAIGFIRQRNDYHARGMHDISHLMLGAGLAFLAEAVVVGLIVPAAPYGPVSYYNYDRVLFDTVPVEQVASTTPFSMISWLDYDRVKEVTGLPIQFWRVLSAIAVLSFVVRSLGVFDALERQRIEKLQAERDRAQSVARYVAESWTNALVTISRRIAELDTLDNILLDIVHNAQNLLNSDFVAIGMLDDDGQRLLLYCYADREHGAISLSPGARIPIVNPLIIDTLVNATPYCSDETEPPNAIEGLCCGVSDRTCVAAIVPLLLDDYPMGALWSTRSTPTAYTATDLIGLERMADQAVIVIQHGLMTAKLQSLAVVGERSRIAREMHDGLAQVLGYLNLQVQTLEALVKQDKRDSLLAELQQMREAVQMAHADVRENILSLRTTLATDAGVASAIADYLDGFSIQTGIEVHFFNSASDGLGLSPLAEVQFVCILQEALANVRKHAHAKTVTVTLERIDGAVCLEIKDDGIGFTQPDAKHCFGLHTMMERAQGMGGCLSIQSVMGKGTRVFCQLPEVEKKQDMRATMPLPHFQDNSEVGAQLPG